MTRLRRAWAVLMGRNDPETAALKLMTQADREYIERLTREATGMGSEIRSLRASLDDATRTIARLSGEKAGLERKVRAAHKMLDDALANPTEQHR